MLLLKRVVGNFSFWFKNKTKSSRLDYKNIKREKFIVSQNIKLPMS